MQCDACSQLWPAAPRSQVLAAAQGDVTVRLLLLQLQEAVGARHCKGWEVAGGGCLVGSVDMHTLLTVANHARRQALGSL